MAKHRRWSDKPKPESDNKEEKITLNEEKTVISEKPTDIKSIILSGTKYVYIVIVAALLSGIFTPLTLGVEIENVIFGMLSIILGLVGGILIFLATKSQKMTLLLVCGGLAMIIASLFLIHELAGRSFF
ncbi:MAG: hypothetical protein VX721_01045 [Thermoproteota archaeon]|nr:hypothetical protein [Thermoproteota archaeon]